MNRIYSLRIEKHVLGGLLKYPTIYADIERYISEKDFYNDVHKTIFSMVRATLLEGKKVDKVILAERIKNLGISFPDEIDIYSYIDNISFTQITNKATIEAAQELKKITIRREIYKSTQDVQRFLKDNASKSIDEIITTCDSLYGQNLLSYGLQEEPTNLFDGMSDLIEQRGNEPQEDFGLTTPFEEFNRMYGGLRPGNLYAFVARPAQGKTTWLDNLAFKVGLKNDVKVLLLDTEMSTMDIQFRMAAALTGTPMWYLETGNWRRNEQFVTNVRTKLKEVRNYECFHMFVGNKTDDNICSLVRRWHMAHVKRGNQCVVVYDYVKLTGEKLTNNWAEYQIIGDKIDKFKKLSEEINAPFLTAMQLNRSGEAQNRRAGGFADDSSAIAVSDRLQWFASFVAIIRRKTFDEIALDGENFGSHKMIPLKTRFQGRDAAGHNDFLLRRMADGAERMVGNYINFDIENFDVEERGSLRHVIEAQNETYELNDGNPQEGESLL